MLFFLFFITLYLDHYQEEKMAHVILTHKVKDFDRWLNLYDADKSRREETGVKELGIFRKEEDSNEFLLHWEVQDVPKFQSMMDSPELKEKMQEAGVIDPPQVWITNKFR